MRLLSIFDTVPIIWFLPVGFFSCTASSSASSYSFFDPSDSASNSDIRSRKLFT